LHGVFYFADTGNGPTALNGPLKRQGCGNRPGKRDDSVPDINGNVIRRHTVVLMKLPDNGFLDR